MLKSQAPITAGPRGLRLAHAAPRVRSHCRFRNRGTEYVSELGKKRMSGSTKRVMRPSPSSACVVCQRTSRSGCWCEKCVRVAQKVQSRPIRSGGGTVRKGWSWPNFWANSASFSLGQWVRQVLPAALDVRNLELAPRREAVRHDEHPVRDDPRPCEAGEGCQVVFSTYIIPC